MTLFGFLSTYPPTRCGLATFTAALATAVASNGVDECLVVRVDDGVPAGPSATTARLRVVPEMLKPGSAADREAALAALDACDVVVIQHEYGIYGGPDGEEIVDLLERLRTPRIVVMHTVLPSPTAHQRSVTARIIENSDVVVAMTSTAASLLSHEYGVPDERLRMIPHGVDEWRVPVSSAHSSRPVLLTWGLLGPGKGIEWVIRALATMKELTPQPVYRVLGQTHPKVVREDGERYRRSLWALADELGVGGAVEIDPRYLEMDELAEQVAAADIVVLPYDSHDQATSGVLVEAMAAGKLVVATRFPHAIEMLAGGGGALVAHQDPDAIASAVRGLLEDPRLAMDAAARSRDLTSVTGWNSIADRYRALAAELSMAGSRR
ncbi:glycosyltransferase [Microbacterium phyllosphaerae]|uniref:glycosyltransferase n=1 Tax=Microbacterium phyllosphaerae TaxID=124798 RepID=UPI00216A296B|nr:glycosyltransferase [Microbacterium phyllosphaerae]MCS3444586.1 glycosyltransferase involved in cell wall biosynthesis [Microbacterium phyllosphaerae]